MYLRYCKKTLYLQLLKKSKGLDFTGRIEDTDKQLRGYEGCYPVRDVLNRLNIRNTDSILDIGCGKGLFLYYASKYKFSRIDGIEYSYELSLTAKRNARIINNKSIHIYHSDARTFTGYDKYNYYFINNPFNAEIMEWVVCALIESSLRRNKKIIVIYQFPFNKSVFEKMGFEIIYQNYPNCVLTFN